MKKNTTKRSLALSVLSLVICVAMLLGTTFAWFTDSVTSGVNKIVAGNLDVELYHKSNLKGPEKVTEATDYLFKDVKLWEPGAVSYETFTVKNVGSLALKYSMALNTSNVTSTVTSDGVQHDLTEVLKVKVLEDGQPALPRNYTGGTPLKDWSLDASDEPLYPAGSSENHSEDTFTVVVYWEPGENDNWYNLNNNRQGDTALSVDISVKLVATQLTYEDDSFDDQYDKDVPVFPAGVSEEDFEEKAALVNGEYYDTFSEALTAATNADKPATVYLAPKSTIPVTDVHQKLNGDVTIFGNDSTFESAVEFDLSGTPANGTSNIKIYGMKKVGVWGNVNEGANISILIEDCDDVHEVMVQSGKNATVNTVVKNCTFDGTKSAGMTGVSQDCGGSVTVENCTFANMLCGVNVKNDYGTLAVSIKGCTFTDCGLTTNTENAGSNTNLGAAIRRGAKTGASGSLTVDSCRFIYSDNAQKILDADIIIGENRTNKDGSGKITYEVKNTDAGVNVYTTHASSVDSVESRTETATKAAGVSGNNGKVIVVVPAGEQTPAQASIAALTNQENAGATVVLPASCEIPLKGKNVANGITVRGSEGTTIVVSTDNYAPSVHGNNVTYEGVNFRFDNGSTYNAIAYTGESVTFNNCTFTGLVNTYGDYFFNNCTFSNTDGNYCAHIYGYKSVFTDCTFNCGNKCVYVYTEGGNGAADFIRCHFNMKTNSIDKSAIMLNKDDHGGNGVLTVTITNCDTCEGFGGNMQGTQSSDGPNYNYQGIWGTKLAPKGTVTVNGVVVYSKS